MRLLQWKKKRSKLQWKNREEEGVTVKEEEEEKEEDVVFGVNKEGEIGDLINTSKFRLKFIFNFGYSELARQYLFNGEPWDDDWYV